MSEALPPILDKATMYRLLWAGRLGNTNPFYASMADWRGRDRAEEPPAWGLRSRVPGDPRGVMNLPTAEVEGYVLRTGFEADMCNISGMIDPWTAWRGHVLDTERGPCCWGAFGPREADWRSLHRDHAVHTFGSAALALLRQVLNDNSFEDVQLLRRQYPDHVIELSAMERCYGTVPHRNAVIWEVRSQCGRYEGWRRPTQGGRLA